MNCKTHKTYRGIRKPTSTCRKCKLIFAWRKVLKACGFPVAEVRRAPKSEATKVGEFCKEFGVAVLESNSPFSPEALARLANEDGAIRASSEGHVPGIRFDAVEPDFPVLTQDRQDALKLTLAELKAGAEARAKTWEADAKELLRVNESLVQVRNIGEGAKAE